MTTTPAHPSARESDVDIYCIAPGATLRETALCIDRNRRGIALVVDGDRRLQATVTDGDLRRALLAGATLGDSLSVVMEQKRALGIKPPVTARIGVAEHETRALMLERSIRQLPLVDEGGRVAALCFLEDLALAPLPVSAVVMAGGFGQRLRPLTEDTPKPMLPVGDKPILEHIVDHLADAGIRDVHVTTHFQPEKIHAHFGDGSAFGVSVRYVREDVPLGTAGALALVERPTTPLLVMNGDIMTRVSFRALYAFHREHGAQMTVGTCQYEIKVPYGVVESDGARVRAIKEKPSVGFLVNAGIYLLEPTVLDLITRGERLDMTDLIDRVIASDGVVVSFPIVEYWVDVGQLGDYERARTDFDKAGDT